MANLTVQVAILAGIKPAAFAECAVGGDAFTGSGREIIHIKNGHSGAQSIIIDSPTACNQGQTHDVTISIPAGEEKIIGPFPKARFNDTTEKVQLTYTAVTLLTIAVIQVP